MRILTAVSLYTEDSREAVVQRGVTQPWQDNYKGDCRSVGELVHDLAGVSKQLATDGIKRVYFMLDTSIVLTCATQDDGTYKLRFTMKDDKVADTELTSSWVSKNSEQDTVKSIVRFLYGRALR